MTIPNPGGATLEETLVTLMRAFHPATPEGGIPMVLLLLLTLPSGATMVVALVTSDLVSSLPSPLSLVSFHVSAPRTVLYSSWVGLS